jgi:predicted ATPase/DNA-binding winged helix-turn-helix (wHTH) protein
MTDAAQDTFRFGTFEVRPAQRVVMVDGQQAPVGARAIDVLVALLERRDRVVTKQELLDLAWPGLVVEENNLQVQISALRKLLGPQAIATVPGRGYRFTALPAALDAAPRSAETAKPGLRGNLPAARPQLIGRDAETAELARQVRVHRIVTVVGAGGIGKTQLALAVGGALRKAFEHGVWLVDLASVVDPALVVSAVAQALGISLQSVSRADEVLAKALRGRELLLVLDNCEHVVDTVGPLVETLARDTALVRVLATSQERLRITDEQLYRIAPLGIPARATLEEAAEASAVSLFVKRVQALQVGFTLDAHNVATVVDICRQLDGLPLAIELAAARTPLLGAAGVRERLGDRFRLLTAGARTAKQRHQTLREMLDWSCGLLGEAERTVFTRAGVFVGSFSLEAAQAVLSDDHGIDPWTVVDLLGSLVDKSLIVTEDTDPPRLRLLETMRAYALDRLHASAADAEGVLRRHAEAMRATLAASLAQAWTVPSQVRLAQALPDLDNLRAALSWARRTPDAADIHVALAGASGWLWFLASQRVEGLSHLEAALARVGPETAADTQARLLAGWASLRFPAAGPAERTALRRAMDLFAKVGDRRGAYGACWAFIRAAAVVQDVPACHDGARELESLFDPTWPLVARWDLLTARFVICWCTDSAAVSTVLDGIEESLRIAEDFGDHRLRATSLMYLEQITEGLGRFDEAVQRGRQLLALLRDVPFTMLRPMALSNLCLSLTHLDRLDEALEVGREALAEHRMDGTPAVMLDAAALLAMKRGRFEVAAKVLGRADALVASVAGARQPNEVRARSITLDGIQAALPAADLQRLMRAGALLEDDEAATLAVEYGTDAGH